jgi:hypothetical protein
VEKTVGKDEREIEEEKNGENSGTGASTVPGRRLCQWVPRSLKELFGGNVDPSSVGPEAFDDESRLMELLQAEGSDEEPDDGEMEGSGDDYVV